MTVGNYVRLFRESPVIPLWPCSGPAVARQAQASGGTRPLPRKDPLCAEDTSGTTKTGAGTCRPPPESFLLLIVAATPRRDLGPLAVDVRVLALLAQVLLEVLGPILVSLELVVHEL